MDVTITSLKVIDLLGNEVLLSTNGINKIDVSDLSSGIYIISLVTNYGNWNGKFVKK
ncbi:T9SS type A sorting domain-containing protein [Flavobacterium sp.]|uniref:T9SS type A sorting domain-containing protein n=1 Tax=Flavobacterium sp. TaxID=239 RepID=UPI0037515A00